MWMIPAAMALGSVIDGEQKRKAQKASNMAQAEQSRYAYLTGGPMGQITPIQGSAFGDAAKGGVSGYALAQGFNKATPTVNPEQMAAEDALNKQLEAMKQKNQMDYTSQLSTFNPYQG